METAYPWYNILYSEEDLQQGDFIQNCPIIIPSQLIEEGMSVETQIKLMNVVILTQSCDLAHSKIENILVCPYYSGDYFLDKALPPDKKENSKHRNKKLDEIRRGLQPAYHLLNKQKGIFEDYLVVDFKNVYGIHRSTLKSIIEKQKERIRLLPPYREHLSQSFARYFMRVGLPQDINIE
jgi:hypothetical protein